MELLTDIDKCRSIYVNAIDRCYRKRQFPLMLKKIKAYSKFSYSVNQYYWDKDVERILSDYSNERFSHCFKGYERIDKHVVFFDSFGIEPRGLAGIYVNALLDCGIELHYVTYSRNKGNIPQLLSRVNNCEHGHVFFLDDAPIINQTECLCRYLCREHIGKLILYATPDEMPAVLCSLAAPSSLECYRVDLTDHAFWLGITAVDYDLVFRDYGGDVAVKYRDYPANQIFKIPYYPQIPDYPYKGLPFSEDRVFILSGGSLYKTIGANNLYYTMVDLLLEKNPQCLFYYLGDGETRYLYQLKDKYPDRVFHDSERKDFYEVLKRASIYLSTYPMMGGLMTQYATIAGVVPVTLRFDECGEGVLLDSDKLNTEFDDLQELVDFVTRYLSDSEFALEYKTKLSNQVVDIESFGEAVRQAICYRKCYYDYSFRNIDTTNFRETYIQRLKNNEYLSIFGSYDNRVMLREFPLRVIIGSIYTIVKKILGKCHSIILSMEHSKIV